MKKSELKQLIKEELARLTEIQYLKPQRFKDDAIGGDWRVLNVRGANDLLHQTETDRDEDAGADIYFTASSDAKSLSLPQITSLLAQRSMWWFVDPYNEEISGQRFLIGTMSKTDAEKIYKERLYDI